MSQEARKITREDIISVDAFGKTRSERRNALRSSKQHRRIALGPDATLYFESYETMWFQVHEMLYIEKGGEEQIKDELAAYNPLIPNGSELSATLMFEINDEVRRTRVLHALTDVELKIYIEVAGERTFATPEQDVERTSSEGKTSSVHFLHFPLSSAQREAFTKEGTEVILGCTHDNYGHMVRLNGASRAELAKDFA